MIAWYTFDKIYIWENDKMNHFENESKINQKTYEELKWHLIPKKEKVTLTATLFSCVIIIIWGFYTQRYEFTIVGFVAGIFLGLLGLSARRNAIRAHLHSIEASTGTTELQVKTFFSDDEISAFNFQTEGTTTFNYDDIHRLIETKSLYVLVTKINQFLVIDKVSLAQEEKSEDFLRFIKDKCKNIKW